MVKPWRVAKDENAALILRRQPQVGLEGWKQAPRL